MDNIKFTGYMENVLTFECDETVVPDCLVSLSGSGTAIKASENANFVGKCLNVKNGIAAVQLGGYVETAKTGAVNVGFQKLAADSAGGVKTATGGREHLVIFSSDTTVGFIL